MDEAKPGLRQMLNKVPEITLYFWVVKILCTTVGETAADFLNTKLGLGLTKTTLVMGLILTGALYFQLRLKKYVPWAYWLVVVLLSIVGTLFTDNLIDDFHLSLVTITTLFTIGLAAVFYVWYRHEKTLSVHSIQTPVRERFYWATIFMTFALGTAAGDLFAERLALGYFTSALIFGGVIAAIYFAHTKFKLGAMLAFWAAYVLTRPLGASIGDFLSQPKESGGLELGTVTTSAIFMLAILGVVVYLSKTKADQIKSSDQH